jgi:hypothetical protein
MDLLIHQYLKIIFVIFSLLKITNISFATTRCIPHSWDKKKISSLPIIVKEKLANNLYQEAIWELSKNKLEQEKNDLRDFLEKLMGKSKVDNNFSKKLLQGATKPISISLECNIEAIFKKKKHHPSSNYKFEITAYLVDKLFGFDLVPVTIEKNYNNQIGSLQYFIKDSSDLNEIKQLKKKNIFLLFDFLISNKDRNIHNIIVKDDYEIAIDHGLAFKKHSLLGSCLHFCDRFKKLIGVPYDPMRLQHLSFKNKEIIHQQDIINNIISIDTNLLETALNKTLSKKRIKHIIRNIQKLKQKFVAPSVHSPKQ